MGPDGATYESRPARQGPVVLSYERIHQLAVGLADSAAAEGGTQVLVAVGRGGLVPGVIMSHRMGVRDLRTVVARHTVDDKVGAAKTGQPGVMDATLGQVAGRDVLIVDDIAGTGKTLTVVAHLVAAAGACRVRSAVLAVNRANLPVGQPLPDYVGEVVDAWVVFPWERGRGQAHAATGDERIEPVAFRRPGPTPEHPAR